MLMVQAAQLFGGCIWLSLGHYGETRETYRQKPLEVVRLGRKSQILARMMPFHGVCSLFFLPLSHLESHLTEEAGEVFFTSLHLGGKG